MARLTEFQSKSLVNAEGITVPAAELVHSLDEAERAVEKIGFPLVLKVQALCSGRFKKGYIKILDDPGDLKSVLDSVFTDHADIVRKHGLLVEEKKAFEREYYLSIVSDGATLKPLVLFSSDGGVDIEQNQGNIRKCYINILEGITDADICSLVKGSDDDPALRSIFKKAYDVYRNRDCSLMEINPFVFSDDEYVALDSKIVLDGDALFRQADSGLNITEENLNREPTEMELNAAKIDESDHRGTVHLIQLDSFDRCTGPRIGMDCVGTGVSLTIMDELMDLGYVPANFGDTSGNPPASKLYRAVKLILAQKEIEGFIFASCVSSQQLDNTARGIIKAFKDVFETDGGKPDIPCLFMFRGAWDRDAIALFREHGIADSENVVILSRDATEYDAAQKFHELYKARKAVMINDR